MVVVVPNWNSIGLPTDHGNGNMSISSTVCTDPVGHTSFHRDNTTLLSAFIPPSRRQWRDCCPCDSEELVLESTGLADEGKITPSAQR